MSFIKRLFRRKNKTIQREVDTSMYATEHKDRMNVGFTHDFSHHVDNPLEHVQQLTDIFRANNDITRVYSSSESLQTMFDISIICVNNDNTETTPERLYTLLANQMRESWVPLYDIKFLPDHVAHHDFSCDEDGTRLTIYNEAAPWATIMVNIEFIRPQLYYCEFEIQIMDNYRFIMFGCCSKEHACNVKRTCIAPPRFYAQDNVCKSLMNVGSKIAIYFDCRDPGIVLYLFIDDKYAGKCADTTDMKLPIIPVVCIANSNHSVKLNPHTFVPVPYFYHEHVLPDDEKMKQPQL
jgi:hypothetical protein